MLFKIVLYAVVGLVVLTGCWIMWKSTARGAYEAAEYKVIRSDGQFELREYPELLMATTPMQSGGQGNDGSFMRLFRYISGDNADSEKVAMTVPVFMEPGGATAGEMGFVIPKQISEDKVPQPADQEVQIRKRSPGTFAAIRFAGRPNRDAFRQAEQELRAWMAEQELVGNNEVEAASYDPPWTPGPFRRNEILIRISPNEDGPT